VVRIRYIREESTGLYMSAKLIPTDKGDVEIVIYPFAPFNFWINTPQSEDKECVTLVQGDANTLKAAKALVKKALKDLGATFLYENRVA
jgi:hypothetical protein